MPSAGIHGFINGVANCYFTSIVQALIHSRTMYEGLVLNDQLIPVGTPGAALAALRDLAREIWNTHGHDSVRINPLYQPMNQYARIAGLFEFGRGNQCDTAMEHFMDAMNEAGIGEWFNFVDQYISMESRYSILVFPYDGSAAGILGAIEQRGVARLPPVLIVNVVPVGSVAPPVALDIPAGADRRYNLMGVIYDMRGHFYSEYLHHGTNVWIRSDDEVITLMNGPPGPYRYQPIFLLYEIAHVPN